MNNFLTGCPFLFLALGLAGCIYNLLRSIEINSILIELSYYAIWGIMALSVLLASYGVKLGKYIAYLLLAVDVVFNLITQHYIAVLVDIAMLVVVSLLLKTGSTRDKGTVPLSHVT